MGHSLKAHVYTCAELHFSRTVYDTYFLDTCSVLLLVAAGLDLGCACCGGLVVGHLSLCGVNRVGVLAIEVTVLSILQSRVHLHQDHRLSIRVHLQKRMTYLLPQHHAWC